MRIIVLVFAWLSLMCSYLYAEQLDGAKAIFFSGEGPTISSGKAEDKKNTANRPNNEKFMGLAYWIDLKTKDGKEIRTTSKREFRSGEKIKLNLKSNKDGYLYVVNIGSTGSSKILFPHSAHDNNFIKANEIYAVPFKNYMMFDENPGEETLLVLLSPKEVKDLFPSTPGMQAEQTNQVIAFADNKGAKDIIFEDDVSTKISPAQYAVAPFSKLENGGAISLFIKFRHK